MEVQLPNGFSAEAAWHRAARLHPLVGRDETMLYDGATSVSPARRTTMLLTRCLDQLGPIAPVTEAAVRSLTVGDRNALLLHLRRLTLGDLLSCVVSCPSLECGEKLDLDLNVGDLLQPSCLHERCTHETLIDDTDQRYRVRFRLPVGEDQENVEPLAREDLDAAARQLLRRCITSVEDADGGADLPDVPDCVRNAVPGLMAELDPQAEITLRLTCPTCGCAFRVPFDTTGYVLRELTGREADLYREVHLLAFHYHWSESEIMSLTRKKRYLYLHILSDALTSRSVG
jgi:hypothetical protein